MDKLKIGIVAILMIFFIGGGYAFYQGNDLVNNAATDISSSPVNPNNPSDGANNQLNNAQNDNINITKDISQNNNYNNFASPLENNYRKIPSADVMVNNNVDFTDLYLQCVACGGFLPLGEVTKALPEGAICHDLCGGSSINYDTKYAATYEFAKAFYDKYGRHPEEIPDSDVPSSSDDANIPATNENDSYMPEGVKLVVYDMNNPDIYVEHTYGPGIYVPEDAKLIHDQDGIQIYDNGMEVHGRNSNSDVVYEDLDLPVYHAKTYGIGDSNSEAA